MNYFVAVNYGTSTLIDVWARSCRAASENEPCKLYLVDNFKSDDERAMVKKVSDEQDLILIENENVGYGKALNDAFDVIRNESALSEDDLIIAGNLDLEIKRKDVVVSTKPTAYMPMVFQDGKDKNPYIKKIQRPLLPLYGLVYLTRSPVLFKAVAGFIKIFKAFPSRPYTCHGSLFVINGALLKDMTGSIFNPDSFLYVEELEFGEYLAQHRINLTTSEIIVNHIGRVSTAEVTENLNESIRLWAPSWRNWRQRWR